MRIRIQTFIRQASGIVLAFLGAFVFVTGLMPILNPGMYEVITHHSVHGLSVPDILTTIIGLFVMTLGYQISKRGQKRSPDDKCVDIHSPKCKCAPMGTLDGDYRKKGYVPRLAVLFLVIALLILVSLLL